MSWPFEKPTPNDPDAAATEAAKKAEAEASAKAGEKTQAELIAESLKPVTEGFTKINERLSALEQNTRKTEPKPNAEANQPTSVFDDENAAFAQRMTPVVLRQLEVESRFVRSEVRAEYEKAGYGDLWSQYEKDINTMLEGTPLVNGEGKVLRGDPQYIRNVVDMIFGREARKAGMRFGGTNKGFFLEGASGHEGVSKADPNADGLTEGQRRVMARMRVPTEDAKKVMAKLKFVNG